MIKLFGKQAQSTNDNSTALQAARDIINVTNNYDISIEKAREICRSLMAENFHRLQGEAIETARMRGDHIIALFLSILYDRDPQALNKANEPDFQATVFDVQKSFALSGDENLGGLLIRLLCERTIAPQRSLKQLTVDEALRVAPKLTQKQINILTLRYGLEKLRPARADKDSLIEFLEEHFLPFAEDLQDSAASYRHLDFVGCLTMKGDDGHVILENLLQQRFFGFFSKGFTEEDLNKFDRKSVERLRPRFVPCVFFENRFRVDAINWEDLSNMHNDPELIPEDKNQRSDFFRTLVDLYNFSYMDGQAIERTLQEICPSYKEAALNWAPQAARAVLSDVGFLIGQANKARTHNSQLEIGDWLS